MRLRLPDAARVAFDGDSSAGPALERGHRARCSCGQAAKAVLFRSGICGGDCARRRVDPCPQKRQSRRRNRPAHYRPGSWSRVQSIAPSGRGAVDRTLREGILARVVGGQAVAEPYDALVIRIADDSSGVTDAEVQEVLAAAGSEKSAFEIVLTAAIGSGLRRWDAAIRAIREAGDASS